MDTEKLVQAIAAEVLRQLRRQEPGLKPKSEQENCGKGSQVLALFTGGAIGLDESLEALRQLQSLGAQITVVLSAAAEKVVGETRVKEQLGGSTIIITAVSPYPGAILRAADLVLIPVLTQNTAAKLAYTLSDTLVPTLVFQALMLGKPVLAAANAADPEDGWRLRAMGKAPPGLVRALQENLKRIQDLGIRLTQAGSLTEAAKTLLACGRQAPGAPAKKTVINAGMIKAAARNGAKTITVAKGAVITPLAYDTARDYGVVIVEHS